MTWVNPENIKTNTQVTQFTPSTQVYLYSNTSDIASPSSLSNMKFNIQRMNRREKQIAQDVKRAPCGEEKEDYSLIMWIVITIFKLIWEFMGIWNTYWGLNVLDGTSSSREMACKPELVFLSNKIKHQTTSMTKILLKVHKS